MVKKQEEVLEEQEVALIFVYGTLRRGFCNHHLVRRGRFLGPGQTVRPLVMHVAGGIPFVHDAETAYPIRGEVYAVDRTTLAHLDDLEDHPHWYARPPLAVCLDDGRHLTAEIYLCRRPEGRRAGSGDYAAFPGIL